MEQYIISIKPTNALIEKYVELLEKRDNINEEKLNDIFLTSEDYNFIASLEENINKEDILNNTQNNSLDLNNPNVCLTINNLMLLNGKLQTLRKNGTMIYLHELLLGSTIILPENQKLERNPELEKRCKKLKIKQDNLLYKSMIKGIDNPRQEKIEDTFAYQVKQMNKGLILVSQFVISVLCGFAFGFLGLMCFFGEIDTGVRILLGILCAVIIGISELYFLAKQLQEFY